MLFIYNMNELIKNLPPYIGKEILSYLIPNTKDIIFKQYKKYYNNRDYYNKKYEAAFINHDLCECNDHYLSRIVKKNGKHRYYISRCIEDVMETEYNDRIYNLYMYEYKSYYIGKNLEFALLELFLFTK